MFSALKKRSTKTIENPFSKSSTTSTVSSTSSSPSTSAGSAIQVCFLILVNVLLWGRITHRHVDPATVDSVLKSVGTDADTVYNLLQNATQSATQIYSNFWMGSPTTATSDAAATAATTASAASSTETSTTSTTPIPESSVVITAVGLPSVWDVQRMIDSLSKLKGLSSSFKIVVSIESCPESDQLTQLKSHFSTIQFVTDANRLGHVVSLKRGVEVVTTKYVYALLMGSRFLGEIDHTSMVQAMEEHPDFLTCILFRNGSGNNGPRCEAARQDVTFPNGITFHHSKTFEDGNQFATKAFYDHILPAIGPAVRGMKDPMEKAVNSDCAKWAQSFYNSNAFAMYIV